MATRPFCNRILIRLVSRIFLLAALLTACSSPRNSTVSNPDPSQPINQPTDSYPPNQRPTVFTPHPGQTDSAILFRTLGSALRPSGQAGALLFSQHEILFPLAGYTGAGALLWNRPAAGEPTAAAAAEPSMLRLQFVGSSPETRVIGADALPGVVNYFLGDDPANWRTGLPTYESVVYQHLYPGIDLHYKGAEGTLKGTFLVAPGADPDDIRWRYEGAADVRVDDGTGNLLVEVQSAVQNPQSTIVEHQPVAWQTISGRRVPIEVQFAIQNAIVSFDLGNYNPAYPLTIDPTLDYGTYWGAGGCEGSYQMALDANQKVYITGPTNSQSQPPFDCQAGESYDIYVTKLDPSQAGAAQLVYTTYIGGADFDNPDGIDVDASEKVYVAGFSHSDDFPTTDNAYQSDFNGGYADCVAIQLDASGVVHYATYLGGSGFEEFLAVAHDGGLLYAAGASDSTDFPVTPDALQATAAGVGDVIVSVLDPSLSGAASLVYSTYYGGTAYDEDWAIDAVNGIVYFAGNTLSDDLTLANPTQPTHGGGSSWGDAFLARLDPSESGADQLLFATYLGGSGSEATGGIRADTVGNVYWVGITGSTDFPATPGSPDYAGGEWDAFLVKVNTATPNVAFSRLHGGSGDDGFRAVIFDSSGKIYAAGATGSDDLPTLNPIQNTWGGGEATLPVFSWLGAGDGLVAAFDPAGALTFSTFLGGADVDAIMGIGFTQSGDLYVAGGTESTDLQTVNPYQAANAGGFDAFVAIIGGFTPPGVKIYLPIVVR